MPSPSDSLMSAVAACRPRYSGSHSSGNGSSVTEATSNSSSSSLFA